MIEMPDRTRLLIPALLGGAAAVAALSKSAQADTAFTSFAFMSSQPGATTARTDPQRWADVINVLDYGADPTNTNDNSTAFKNAWKAALSLGPNFGPYGGTVFVPPGIYKLTSTVDLNFPFNLYPQLITNAATAAGNTTLHFASIPGVFSTIAGLLAIDLTDQTRLSYVPVQSINTGAGTMTLASGATGSGISSGDTIAFISTNAGARIVGSGSKPTQIVGNFNGWLFTKNDNTGTFKGMENITLANNNSGTSSGCFQLTSNGSGYFLGISFSSGFCGADVDNNSFGVPFFNCSFDNPNSPGGSPALTGSTGCFSAQGNFVGCSFTGWDVGLNMGGAGCAVQGSRFEVNNTGIQLGNTHNFATHGMVGYSIIGCTMEANLTAIRYVGGGADGIVAGNYILGETGNSRGNSQQGIVVASDKCSNTLFAGNTIQGAFTSTAFEIHGGTASNGNVVVATSTANSTGTAWSMPGIGGWQFYGNADCPGNILTYTFLPGSPTDPSKPKAVGDTYIVSDCAVGNCSDGACNWGANVTGGGGSLQRVVQWNGTNWTVVGK